MVKIVWSEEEVVQRNKISFQEPHQQYQVHTISKLTIGEKQMNMYQWISLYSLFSDTGW